MKSSPSGQYSEIETIRSRSLFSGLWFGAEPRLVDQARVEWTPHVHAGDRPTKEQHVIGIGQERSTSHGGKKRISNIFLGWVFILDDFFMQMEKKEGLC